MQGKRWALVVATSVLLTSCAGPGNTPGNPEPTPGSVTAVISAANAGSAVAAPRPVPAPARSGATPARSGAASCAQGAMPMPSLDPSTSFDVNDPVQRARRALAERHRPTPRRGPVPEAAVPGAEACIYALKLHFSLLTSGSQTVPDNQAIGAALNTAGLTKIVVRPGPTFAASTGAACVHGTFTTTGPAFTIAPLAADGSCPP